MDHDPAPSERELHPTPTLQVDGNGIAWLTFDDPERKQNVLTEGVMRRLASLMEEAEAMATAGQMRALVVWSGKSTGFIAGADVEAVAAVEDPREGEAASRLGQAIFMDVEELPVPTVAAIHGVCMGGGTELALACTYRIASDAPSTRIGLPEVQLGILPAWGGTTRLPRLVGLQAALEMLLTGDTVSPSKAKRIGLVNEVLPADLFRQKALDFALAAAAGDAGPARPKRGLAKRLVEDTAPGRKLVLRTARKRVMAQTGGHYPAPLRILDLLDETLGGSVERSLRREAEVAGELIATPVSKNLLHVFRLRERARKETGAPAGVVGKPVESVVVLGAGVMGGGIAQLLAYRGRRVRMKDIHHEAVASGLQHARGLFDKAVEKRKMARREADQAMERVSGGVEYHGLGSADLVVEAVVERMDVKRQVLGEAEERVGDGCVMATNTSSLSVDAMSEGLERPHRFGGLHFFNPVHKMPLVEVVKGRHTDDETVATLYRLAVDLGKVPVVVKDGPGFLVNRILGPYLNEAGWLLVDGASVEEVDAAAKSFGMPMGPLRLVDEVGIDIARHAGQTLHEAFGERLLPSPPLVAVAASGRVGRKGGRGFYVYEDDKEQGVDETVYADLGGAVPTDRGGVDEKEIRHRLVLSMINEAARVLEDGIVGRAGDVDLGLIMGTGFPPFRGGLLRFADTLHPRRVYAALQELHARHGHRFEPAPLVRELAEKDQTFYRAFGG
ncbi:MAG: enoyl-CoA hydratase/isomerase family protein [Gemmatimonadetes bacterium]|nr:enoyl-CoA hydratase/isomerase family protein [Gemmatimonadota bacterium]